MLSKKSDSKEYQEQILRLWTASVVVAVFFLIATSISTFFRYEEAEIRRESYLANLVQLYEQEIQQCYQQSSAGEEAASGDATTACLKQVNEEGRYAELVEKWGGSDSIVESL